MSKFRWIRSEPLRNLLIKAEHLDLVGDTEFFCVADMIDVLAPVYDNGNSFANKSDDEALAMLTESDIVDERTIGQETASAG